MFDRKNFKESRTAKALESRSAQVGTDVFFWAALGSIAGSAYLKMKGREQTSLFVGQWAPTFLTIGVYNKLVKLFGSD